MKLMRVTLLFPNIADAGSFRNICGADAISGWALSVSGAAGAGTAGARAGAGAGVTGSGACAAADPAYVKSAAERIDNVLTFIVSVADRWTIQLERLSGYLCTTTALYVSTIVYGVVLMAPPVAV